MKTIGITGGIGAGKSEILKYISDNYNCEVITTDKLAYELESPGGICYEPILNLLGRDITDESGYIVRNLMAAKIFSDSKLLTGVNEIIHPAVREVILSRIAEETKKDRLDYFFVEAALLIEEGYDSILDELWYIRVDENIRRERLKSSRGYSDAKIDSILASQLSDEVYRLKCRVVIDNSGSLYDTYLQIDKALS